ncbi:molybdopterin-dependent oxidoreductase [Nocardioides sp. Kera G14]|uniref:molybdopterin-dependent oxidoreductase n=1 Tax=Nocardioides sp. Kera G14 TaxID=2884264 RepID=UPI001D121FC8|nr:molybdopterin-dependent oxidoreductase [Nocardioides sp. Kera G14]UDY24028.1 molybdopterin-dependent oxidoreductase [Nocardioides sp. Kera G14]
MKKLMAVLAGLVSAALGIAVGHLAAAFGTPSASPVLAVGSAVIDRTPTPVKEWAIAHFGTHDKVILVGSVLLVVLAAAGGIGLLAGLRRFVLAGLGLAALTAFAAAAALSRPTANVTDAVPSLVTGVVATLALVGLTRVLASRPARVDGTEGGRGPGRRTVVAVGALAGTAVAAVGVGGTARWLVARRTRAEQITLPAPADPAPPLPAGLDRTVPGITAFRTPNARFYRVDTRLDTPVVDSSTWRLRIDGDVDRTVELSFDDLLAMPLIERDITLTCVSNSVGGPYTGAARWLGVRLTDLLDQAGVGPHADQILSTDVGGMTISTPLEAATDGRDAMIAVGMNGEQLPRAHGFPARLIVPGLYGFIGATKWITRMTLTTYADHTAYWTDRKWATDAPIKPSSRIDTPRPLASLKAGDVVIGGVAWAQERDGVEAVEVRIDGGPWQRATLGPSGGEDYWRQWFTRWDATPGDHTLACRVLSGDGATQTPVRANPFPDGASGIQSISVSVA